MDRVLVPLIDEQVMFKRSFFQHNNTGIVLSVITWTNNMIEFTYTVFLFLYEHQAINLNR